MDATADATHLQQFQAMRCRGKDGTFRGKCTTEVQVHAGNVAVNPRAVQLPPCTASSDSYLASCGGHVSIRKAFDGATVLLTGGTGFVGSLVSSTLAHN